MNLFISMLLNGQMYSFRFCMRVFSYVHLRLNFMNVKLPALYIVFVCMWATSHSWPKLHTTIQDKAKRYRRTRNM